MGHETVPLTGGVILLIYGTTSRGENLHTTPAPYRRPRPRRGRSEVSIFKVYPMIYIQVLRNKMEGRRKKWVNSVSLRPSGMNINMNRILWTMSCHFYSHYYIPYLPGW